ncbi:DUF2339 domain-containing protein [Empedobacter stercoris]|uniref:DUF2339 domain-containing protein n=1 Tax=Empedobacter stercoris TaxID=1628248 RepID=A0ABX1WL73_9FLAO|nr:DUF2339 domain-containing protein [Empedobacter stercoris]NOJ75384.1 DUF2339 domain-containing protein [Empedobacter stercoris]
MEFFIAIIIIVLIVILFNKVSQLKKQLDEQETKLRHLQQQLDEKETIIKSTTIVEQPKKVEEAVAPQSEIVSFNKPEPPKRIFDEVPPRQKTKNNIDKHLNNGITFIRDNFLTIFGIVTLVLGIAYFVKYAIDQNWINETFRVLIGLVVGLSIIGIAHNIRKNYAIFSSILIGGGLTVLYFTLTIAFREYQLLSQHVTFTLLALVTIFSIVMAMLYNRQVLAIFSILGGFTAPLMISTGESNYIFLFAYLVILNFSMLFMAWRKNWQVISFIAFCFTSIYSISWIDQSKTSSQFLFFTLLYAIFTITSSLNYFKKGEFWVWNSLLLILNTILSTILISSVYYFMFGHQNGLIAFIFSLINILGAFYIYKTSTNNLLKNTFIGLGVALFTTSIALQFEANVVSISFAVESTLLLYLWKKSRENIFKIFFIAMFPFLLIALCINWFDYIDSNSYLPIIFNYVFITSFVALVCSIANIYLMKDFDTEEQFLGFKLNHSKFIFISTSLLLMYTGILFELIYQIEPYFNLMMIISYVLIYTIFFIAFILVLRKNLNLGPTLQLLLQISAGICILLLPLFAEIPSLIYKKKLRLTYSIYLTYLIPTAYIVYLVIKNNHFKRSNAKQIICMLIVVYTISFEKYNSFMLLTLDDTSANFSHQADIFRMILLPIIWAVLGFGLMYFGLKKQLKGFPIVGIILFGLIILKLYLIDVWEMSNVYRIISFIVLGILILFTSFMYQKLKNLMKNLMEKPNDNTEAEQ